MPGADADVIEAAPRSILRDARLHEQPTHDDSDQEEHGAFQGSLLGSVISVAEPVRCEHCNGGRGATPSRYGR